jgi:hypothetical protein
MASHLIEIARQEGAEFRSVRLSLEDDGTIKMDAQDIGLTVTRIWGDELGAGATDFAAQARLRTIVREVFGPVGCGRCVPGLAHNAWRPT